MRQNQGLIWPIELAESIASMCQEWVLYFQEISQSTAQNRGATVSLLFNKPVLLRLP